MLMEILLEELTPSPTNPRKTFDPVKLEELARSIATKGVLEPILVRDLDGSHPGQTAEQATRRVAKKVHGAKYEIVAGERRYRAAVLAKVETVPCIVRELDDVEVLEVQTIENLQRDDLHPLEEAAGYAALIKRAGYDVEQIAQRISKSAKYVYDRVKLLQLVPDAQKIFLGGEISAGHAIILARLGSDDQQRAMNGQSNGFHVGGLFQPENVDAVPGLELDDKRKAVSVREFEHWINDHVRFKAGDVDLPNLFPDTAAALAVAEEEELKVVHITHDYRVPDAARDEKERTYGRPSWKRADGELDGDDIWAKRKPSKECEHSVMGVVVAGPDRGSAFKVCVAKKKCTVHWKEEQKEAEQRSKNGASPSQARDREAARHRSYEEQRKREEAERERWKKAVPQLLEAIAEKLKATPPLKLVDLILEEIKPYGLPKTLPMGRGKTLDDAVRFAAFLVVADDVRNNWNGLATKTLKSFGIDAKKIVDQVAPPVKQEKKKPAKGTKGTAGTCRECGCTDDDCSQCIGRTGDACSWVEPDLCSACVPVGAEPKKGARARRRAKRVQTSAA